MKIVATTESALGQPDMMTWDTEFFGIRVGRSSHPDVDAWALKNTVGLICLLCDTAAEVQEAEARGFRFMDVRVTLERRTAPIPTGCMAVRPAQVDPLAALARVAFRGLTRFYADPTLPNERCDDLYEAWFRNTVADPHSHVLSLGRKGFVTVTYPSPDRASLGLIAVRDDCRGEGVGEQLVRAAIDRAHASKRHTIEVVTQGCNIAAQRTFQSCGFRVTRTQVWMHKRFC